MKTSARAGLEFPEGDDGVGALFANVVFDTLDDLAWPEHGRRLAVTGEWSLGDLGADREYWRVQAEGRVARALGRRVALQVDGFAGLSGDDLPAYDWYRVGGVTLIPGYPYEELKGAQALAGALSLRGKVFGQLRVVVRGGAGNVFATTDDITLHGLRRGLSAGVYHPGPIGPVSFELGVRDGGRTLGSLSIGWN